MKSQKNKFIATVLATAITATTIQVASAEPAASKSNEKEVASVSVSDYDVSTEGGASKGAKEDSDSSNKGKAKGESGASNEEKSDVSKDGKDETEASNHGEIKEIPTVVSPVTPTDSTVRVNGTKDWDKDLVLTPENGDINVKLNLSGEDIPSGTKIELRDGTKVLASTTVDGAGEVNLVAKDLPKDVKSLSIVAIYDGANMVTEDTKCTADSGIDIPSSKTATTDALAKFEEAYEKAYNDYADGVTGSKDGEKIPDKTTVIDGKVTTVTSTSVIKGKKGEAPKEEKHLGVTNPGLLGGLLGGVAGAGVLGGLAALVGPMLAKGFGASGAPGLDKLFSQNANDVNDFFQNLARQNPGVANIIKQGERLIQDLNNGAADAGRNFENFLRKFIDVDGIKRAISNSEQAFKNMLNNFIDMVSQNPQFRGAAEAARNAINNFKFEQLLPLLAIPILGLIIWGIVKSVGEVTETVPGEDGTPDETKTITSEIPGAKITKVTPGEHNPAPHGELTLPTPPSFIENSLNKREVPTQDKEGGVISFDIEVGSNVDCATTLRADVPKDTETPKKDTPDKDKTPKPNDKSDKSDPKDNSASRIHRRINPPAPRAQAPAPAPRAVAQAPAPAPVPVVPMALPSYGPKVDTGGAVETGFFQKIANLFS